MSFANPANRIPRQSVVGMEAIFVKMWDPPTESNVTTPDMMAPTNPVPEVMQAAGMLQVSTPHTVQRDLLHGVMIPTFDGKLIDFMTIRDGDNPTAAGTFPGPTVRMPRGAVYHAETKGHGPPPHTIHWHGIEPTPMNDGVGHCSMEIGTYTYQWQPNFMGFYFYHCHRNTVQHFEFGLYGAMIFEAPDAFFATQWNPAIEIGAGRDGKRRCAANLVSVGRSGLGDSPNPSSGHGYNTLVDMSADFPGYNGNALTTADPEVANPTIPNLPANLKFATDPHAMTVPFDVEALWVVDDRDSRWSDLAPNARQTYPKYGPHPGFDDNFRGHWGGGASATDFFAFNDFHSDYFYVTGVNAPGRVANGVDHTLPQVNGTGEGTIPPGIVIPAALMSGISGVGVSIQAQANQTVRVLGLNAAYNNVAWTFPVDVVILAWDGRALGIAPYTESSHAYLVPANTRIHASVARRFDCIFRATEAWLGAPIPPGGLHLQAKVEFFDTRTEQYDDPTGLRFTAKIPIDIGAPPVVGQGSISGVVTDTAGAPMSGVTVALSSLSLGGSTKPPVVTGALGTYAFAALGGGTYQIMPSKPGFGFNPPSSVSVIGTGSPPFTGDFVGSQLAITGSIVRTDGLPVAGVEVTAVTVPTIAHPMAMKAATAVTDGNGVFTLLVQSIEDFDIVPEQAGIAFAPVSRLVAAGATDAGIFQATPAAVGAAGISGTVTLDGGGLAGVTVNLTGPTNRFVVTDASGNYSFAGLAAGLYTVTPSPVTGYTFNPISREVTLAGVDRTGRNFGAQTQATGAYSISGTVSNQGVPVAGIPVRIQGAADVTAMTDASGNYTFANLPAGSYRIRPTTSGGFTFVSPAVAGLRFQPKELNVTVTNAALTAQNFGTEGAAAATLSISGLVTEAGVQLAGVTVMVTGPVGKSAVTAADGTYSIVTLPPGNYIVTPVLAGKVFSPSSRTITLNQSVTGRDFGA